MSSRQPRGVKMYPWLQKPPDTKATNLTFNLLLLPPPPPPPVLEN